MSALVYISGVMPSLGLDNQPVTATLSFYEAETAQPTPVTVYADPALNTPHPWPVQSDAAGRFPAIYVPNDTTYRVAWTTSDGQSESWDEISGMTIINGAILAGALEAEARAQEAQSEAEDARDEAQGILDQIIAYGGSDGFTPVIAAVEDGARVVLSIGWTGGDGPAPTSGYIGSSGVVATAAAATDIRGYSGSGSGDVVKFGSPTTGRLATWASSSTIQGTVEYAWSALPGAPAFATQAEALTGTSTTLLMSPKRVSEVMSTVALQQMPRLSKGANYQLVANDRGAFLEATASFSLTFDSASGLGTGWFAFVSSGSYEITVNGADALSSYVMYPGEVRLFQGNGTDIKSVVVKGFSKAFTASGTFTKPPGYADFEGEAWGGGGSGASDSSLAGGGGGAACVPFKIRASAVGSAETVTIGAGGASATGSNGNNGESTTLGSLLTAYSGAGGKASGSGGGGGGGGGTLGSAISGGGGGPEENGFGGGSGSLSGAAESSVYGGGGGSGGSGAPGAGGSSVYGGGGGGGAYGGGSSDGLGGTSVFGGNGGRGRYNLNGVAGSAPGGGGGATGDATKSSGAGARGELRIRGVT